MDLPVVAAEADEPVGDCNRWFAADVDDVVVVVATGTTAALTDVIEADMVDMR